MRLTVTSHLTLDGVVQSNGKPEPELNDGFEQGGWQVPYLDDDLGRLATGWIAAADAFLFGRRTYELFAGHWAQITDPNDALASRLNGLPKHVVSRSLGQLAWNNSTLLQGDVAEEVARLKRQSGNELQVHGSGTLIRTLMEHDLIDEYRLFTPSSWAAVIASSPTEPPRQLLNSSTPKPPAGESSSTSTSRQAAPNTARPCSTKRVTSSRA